MINFILRLLAVLAILALPQTGSTNDFQARSPSVQSASGSGCAVASPPCIPCAICASVLQFGGNTYLIAQKDSAQPLSIASIAGTISTPMLRPP